MFFNIKMFGKSLRKMIIFGVLHAVSMIYDCKLFS